jgi:hypothetical protein
MLGTVWNLVALLGFEILYLSFKQGYELDVPENKFFRKGLPSS